MRTSEDQLIRLIAASLLLTAADRAPSALRKSLVERGTQLLAEVDADDEVDAEPFPVRHYEPKFTEEVLRAAGEPDSLLGPTGTVLQADTTAGANGPQSAEIHLDPPLDGPSAGGQSPRSA